MKINELRNDVWKKVSDQAWFTLLDEVRQKSSTFVHAPVYNIVGVSIFEILKIEIFTHG